MGLFDDILEEEGMVEPPPQKQSAIRNGGLFDDILEEEGMLAEDQSQFDVDYFKPKPLKTEKKELPERQSVFRQVADVPLGVARGGVTGIKMMTDILGADNPVSKSLAGVEGYMADLMSAQAKEDQQEIVRIIKDAEDKGFGEQVKAGIKAFSIAPVDIMSQALGTMAPVLATGLAGGAAKLGALGIKGLQLGVGAGMGAGMIKGEIYNEVKNELINSGTPEEVAEKAAVDAQAYGGKNLDQILLGAGLGAASTLGAEGIITRILTKQGKASTAGLVSRTLKGGITEAIPEGIQAAQEQLAKNVALQREGFDVDPSRGVVAAATMEAIAGAPLGGIAGAVERPAKVKTLEEEKFEQTNEIARKVAESGAPLTASALQDKAAANLNQDELARKLDEELSLTAVKPTAASPTAIPTKDDYVARYSAIAQAAPEELTRAEQSFTNELATADTEEKRINAQNALNAIKEVKAVGITPAAQPVTPVTQQPTINATQEIIQQQGVRQEPQDGTQIGATPEAGVSDSILGAERIQEEGQVDSTIFDLQSVANNTATREQISSLSLSGLVDIRKGQAIINEDGEGLLTQAQAPLPALTPEARAAEVEATPVTPTPSQPIIGEIPQTSPIVGEQVTETTPVEQVAETQISEEPIISEKPQTSEIVGAEIPAIIEQEQVVPVERAIDVARKTNFAAAATREEAGDIGRNLAIQDPNLPPSPPQQFEVLESISNFQNRSGYNPDVLTEELINEARNNGFITGKQLGKIKFTETGRNQLREWSDQAKERSLAESALSDEIGDIAVSQWDAANDPTSAAAMAAKTATPPAPVTEPVAEPSQAGIKEPAIAAEEQVVTERETAPAEAPAPEGAPASFGQRILDSINEKLAQGKDVFISTMTKSTKVNKKAVDNWSKAGKPLFKVGKDGNLYIGSGKRYDQLTSADMALVGFSSEGKKLAVAEPAPAVSETITPAAEPEGIAVGNRVKLGKSPQTYTIEEVIPQTATEQGLGEKYYSVKNERTGEVQVVEERDLKPVKKMPIRKAFEGVIPTPDEKLVPAKDIINAVISMFGRDFASEYFTLIDDVNEKAKAAYEISSGTIYLNRAYLSTDDNIRDYIAHELGHYIAGDPTMTAKFQEFFDSLSPKDKAILDRFVERVYNDETGEVRLEEKQVYAFVMRLNAGENRNAFQTLMDAVKKWLNKNFKTKFKMTDRDAAAILAGAVDRFKSGEFIPREEGFGVLKATAEPRREQVAGKERGDIITTPEGIIKQTNEVLRNKFFDGSVVSDENTSAAWDYIEQLLDIKSGAANALAGQINDVVDQETNSDTRMGAGLFSVSLANYSAKLAAQGDTTMISYIIRRINRMPVDNLAGGATDAGRVLRGKREYDIDGYKTLETEHDSKVERTAATLFGTGKPSKEQVDAVDAAIKASEDTSIGEPEEVAGEVEKVEKRTGRKVIKKIDDQISGNIEERKKAALEKQKTRPKTQFGVERQALSIIDQFARMQSDTLAFTEKQENQVRAIVQQDLRQRPDMKRKQPWTSQLTAKLMQTGVSEAQAQTISDLVWRQHEIKTMDRELKELETAAEKGSLAVIIQRIKETPLEDQQKPEWMQGVIREYLIEAGLSSQAADTAARLYESVIAERFAEAKQKAFESTLAKSAPWNNYLSRNAQLGKNALKKIQDAIRTGVLDPTQTTEGIIAKENGWSGFSKEQLTRIVQLDGILYDKNSDQVTKAEAMSELNKIIVKAKMPVRFKDAISAFYVGQALMGIPTFTVNIASPTFFAIRNFSIDIAKYAVTDPKMIPVAFQSFINSFQSLYDNTMYAFKNQIYMSGEIEYMQGQNVLSELFDKGKAQWAKGDYANGMGNMLVGTSQITGRILSSLDQGAIEMMQSQNITRYVTEAISGNKLIPKDKRSEIVNIAISGRRKIKEDLIASGMAPDRAGVLAELKVRDELMASLSGFGIKGTDVLNASINDALQSVGRNRAITINSLTKEQNNLRDAGILSGIPIGFLEGVAQWANKGNQSQQVFAKMIYGFALVPARVFSTALWFSPIGFVRLGVDAAIKRGGGESRYALSLATEFQQKQRLIEAIAGTALLVGLSSLLSNSTDDDEEKPFKIVVTGNGPDYNTDRQYHDSWHKKYKPHTTHIIIGGLNIPINIGRGGEAISIPLIFLGAQDDARIKEKLNQARKSPADLEMAAEVLGSAFYSFSNRGPFAAFTKPLFDAKKPDKVVPNLVSQIGYFGKTFIPIVGTSLARNISDFINDPIDKSSIQGAIYSNMPIVGPMIGTKALNAFGQPIRADDWGDRLFKLGAPVVMSFPKNTPENELNELVLKKGDGPPIPTRINAQKKFEEPLTDKEFEIYVREYGRVVSDKMFKNRKRLEDMQAKNYTKELDKYVNGYSIDGVEIPGASDMAARAVKRSRNE